MLSLFRKKTIEKIQADAGHLTLSGVGNPADFGGIVRIDVAVSPEALAGSKLTARELAVAESSVMLGSVVPGETQSVGVHFCLLENGERHIELELEEPNGAISKVIATLPVDNFGELARETAKLLRAARVPTFFVGPCDSSVYPYTAHTAWFDRPDAGQHIDHLLASGKITQVEADQLRFFVEQGYLVFENLIDEQLIDQVNAEIDDAVAKGYQGYQIGSSQRIEHLHMHYEGVAKLWLDPRHRRVADLIFGAQARPCQTLTYVFGSQQDAHQDTIHLTPFPAGYMCGTWIALQDVVPDSGELIVYPGSHREKRVRLSETGCAKVNGDWSEFGRTVCAEWAEMLPRYQPFVYRPKKGTVLVWHENLLHAGSVRKNTALERRSIVIHSFADGAVAYYDSTGLLGSAVKREALNQAT
ncbi:MAG TPA: phytanoyl-CoA dioxygenase family protein [Pseudoduganella sp.]|jgi:ectoine hydroxylase-related dioxygenase (phytanoyl-CoA dioxygenase family)